MMGNKVLIFLLLLVIVQYDLIAQTPNWQWAKTIGSGLTSNGDGDEGKDIAVDAAGNVYVVGTYHGTVNFGNYLMTSKGSSDIFIASYDCSGSLRWVTGGSTMSKDEGHAVTVHDDAVYIAGWHGPQFGQDSVHIGDTVFRSPMDMFVAKFDTSGNFAWIRTNQVQASFDISRNMSLATDAQGNLYFTSNSQRQTFPGTGYNAAGFLAKYDPQGNLLRVSEVVDTLQGSLNVGTINSLSVDSEGSAYVGGYFSDSIKVGNVTVVGVQSVTGSRNGAFIAKFDTTGTVRWVRQSYAEVSGLSDLNLSTGASSPLLYCTGAFQEYLTWNGGDTLVRSGNTRPYVFILDTAGNSIRGEGPQTVIANTGAVGHMAISNNIIGLPGQIRGAMTWNGISASSQIGISDPVLYILDTALDVQSINVLPTIGNEDGALSAAAFDPNQNIYVTGHVGGDVHLPNDTAYYQGGSTDAVLAKFGTTLGCDSTVIAIREEIKDRSHGISAYPNPTDGPLTIRHDRSAHGGRLLVHDMQGRLLLEREVRQNTQYTELELTGRPAGLYLISIVTDSGRQSMKVVVNDGL